MPPASSSGFRRPGGITLLAVLQFISAFICLLVAVIGIGAGLIGDTGETGSILFGSVLLGAAGSLQLACGLGLWRLQPYGRTIQLVFSWIGLLGFPIGTIVSIVILLYLRKPGIKILFSGRPATEFTTNELAQVTAVTEGSMGVVLAAVVIVVVLVAMTGIVAAIAIPGLLRARMAGNEAATIGTMRAINSAQASYYAQCDGYAPDLPGLKNGIEFLLQEPASAVTVTRNGYNITLEPAETAVLVQNPRAGCAGTVTDFFARADPVTPGSSGIRYFATDARGTIYQSTTPMSDTDTATPLQ
jgi:type IV pilus assembly protein PilA